ncbi:MAG: hypothetical protein VX438_03275 [Planctomycetota bacterium]|nr:hypothetical protein [Planctomycetota bacterium]
MKPQEMNYVGMNGTDPNAGTRESGGNLGVSSIIPREVLSYRVTSSEPTYLLSKPGWQFLLDLKRSRETACCWIDSACDIFIVDPVLCTQAKGTSWVSLTSSSQEHRVATKGKP